MNFPPPHERGCSLFAMLRPISLHGLLFVFVVAGVALFPFDGWTQGFTNADKQVMKNLSSIDDKVGALRNANYNISKRILHIRTLFIVLIVINIAYLLWSWWGQKNKSIESAQTAITVSRFGQSNPIRIVFVMIILGIGYLYGAASYKHELFPIRQASFVKRLFFPPQTPSPEAASPAPAGNTHIIIKDGQVEDYQLHIGYKEGDRKVEVDCNEISKDAAVILAFGQSNAASFGLGRHQASKGAYNLNYRDGKCYRLSDPLMGTSGADGSVWSRLGDELVKGGTFKQVLFVTVAIGGTSINRWYKKPGMVTLFERIAGANRYLKAQGRKFTHLLWHQGESDASTGMTKETYIKEFSRLTDDLRAEGIDAPLFVAVASICKNTGSDAIRAAQRKIPDLLEGVFHGPDSDSLSDDKYRFRQCHFSTLGMETHARDWFNVLSKHKNAKP